MTISRADLVAAFPEFDTETVYPTTQIDFWIGQAVKQISEARFGASYTLAMLLFVAHNIALSAQAARAGKAGGAIGTPGLVASKSIDKVSVSYDLTTTAAAGAGPWNATVYGQRYYALLRSFAVGPAYKVSPRVFAPLTRPR